MNLITVANALEIILKSTENFGTETISFLNSQGRVLKETIVADCDFPPFNRVSMDGIAIAQETFAKGQRIFKIEGVQGAGTPQLTLQNANHCIEVMTGAVLPKNANAVIPYELLEIENSQATIRLENVKYFQNIHKKGLDKQKGEKLIESNTVISPAEIGVLATVGKSMVKVAKQPKVIIVSTGNELVEVTQTPAAHQIRRSNVYTLYACLQNLGITAEMAHILDNKKVLTTKIESFLNEYDVLLFSGAVSKGKFDFIPEVLEKLGVKKQFHKVQQRPGKPFWFGKKQEKTVFAFPGNPVSTFASFLKYFYPWYQKSMDIPLAVQQAILTEDFTFKPQLTYFLQVKLTKKQGELYATPVTGKGSGDLANLVHAHAFLELPPKNTNFTKGEVFPILSYRSF